MCKLCSFAAASEDQLQDHVSLCRRCKECPFASTSNAQMGEHVKVHSQKDKGGVVLRSMPIVAGNSAVSSGVAKPKGLKVLGPEVSGRPPRDPYSHCGTCGFLSADQVVFQQHTSQCSKKVCTIFVYCFFSRLYSPLLTSVI